jgi:hypothetical protein
MLEMRRRGLITLPRHRGHRMAARGARAAAGDAGDRISQQPGAERLEHRRVGVPCAQGAAAQEAAAAVGQPLQILHASTQRHLDDAFATIEQQRIGALLVSPDPFFFTVVLTARHALPTIFGDREQAEGQPTRYLPASGQLRRPDSEG